MVTRTPLTPALWRFGEVGDARGVTFVLAPFAGGSAYSLAGLPSRLVRPGDSALVIQYPGRGPRIGEPHACDLAELAAEVARDLVAHATGPLVLVGHSMGGVLCYELAALLTTLGRPPAWVVVSAARPPGDHRLDRPRVLSMGHKEWLDELAEGGGLMGAEAALVIPSLRADYLMLAQYRPAHGPLASPLLALGGAADPWVSDDHLAAWRNWTVGDFDRATLPGGHFFYRDRLAEFCTMVRDGPGG